MQLGKPSSVSLSLPKNAKALKKAKASQLSVLLVEDNDINRLYAKKYPKKLEL